VGFHYAMDDAEADFVIDAVAFAARKGHRFLPFYRFDVRTGAWSHREPTEEDEPLSLEAALSSTEVTRTARPVAERRALYARYLEEARQVAATLPGDAGELRRLGDEAGELQYFVLPASSCEDRVGS
jgi:hypothetical protein